LLHFAAKKNSLALGQTIRLHDVSQTLLFLSVSWLNELISKVDVVARQHPGLGKEIEL
jgi:hypothetical protein